jgi:hypothetical protein
MVVKIAWLQIMEQFVSWLAHDRLMGVWLWTPCSAVSGKYYVSKGVKSVWISISRKVSLTVRHQREHFLIYYCMAVTDRYILYSSDFTTINLGVVEKKNSRLECI